MVCIWLPVILQGFSKEGHSQRDLPLLGTLSEWLPSVILYTYCMAFGHYIALRKSQLCVYVFVQSIAAALSL